MTETDATVARVHAEQASRILAVLVRLFGTRNLELAEDVLQEAFRKALVAWQQEGVPTTPRLDHDGGASNQAIDTIRGQRTQRRFSDDLATTWRAAGRVPTPSIRSSTRRASRTTSSG